MSNLAEKLERLRPELANRKGVVFQQDNARPHVSLATRTKLHELGWDVLPHRPYSPDIAPSDYHLFLSLQNSLQGKSFIDLEDVKKHVENFFSSKPAKFYADGIFKLPDRWTKVISNNGSYFTEKSLLKHYLSLYCKSEKNTKNFPDNLIYDILQFESPKWKILTGSINSYSQKSLL